MVKQMSKTKINRNVPIDLDTEEFRKIGYSLVDKISELIFNIREMPVTPAEEEHTVKDKLKADTLLPEEGIDPGKLINQTTDLLIKHSLYNGHPRFWGYITSSPAPLGILGDFLASAINSNVGAWALSPMASEIEAQTIRWISSLINYPSGGGLIVSGGNVANYIGFIAGIRAKAGLGIREEGIDQAKANLRIYCSQETHTWIQKAADLFGLGTESIRWIKTDKNQKLDISTLKNTIDEDIRKGNHPFLVVGTAGSVSTGVIDPLDRIANICNEYNLWFHIDGAYGGFAAAVPELENDFVGLEKADSIAIDPHKWLYTPLEAGCTLVKDPSHLTDAFSYHPAYYNFEQSAVNYVDYGIQNSRGFKALKVWLQLKQMGRKGYQQLIREDILLAKYAYDLFNSSEVIETFTNHLSITTFRYVPIDLIDKKDDPETRNYLNELNQIILNTIENSGKFYVSNALINEIFLLRMCIVNFRTNIEDIHDFEHFIIETGKKATLKLEKDNS
jgi:glutamate/tyrosine decarboxylase-like PLP-dependent enzyme